MSRPIGNKKHPEYKSWQAMKTRCLNPNRPEYHYYMGRGITICEQWVNSFLTFLSDVGQRPSPKHSLDRINNDGNYEPGNVRWATSREQNLNKRSARVITVNGESMSMSMSVTQWSELTGIKRGIIFDRLRSGWSDSDSVMTPMRGE